MCECEWRRRAFFAETVEICFVAHRFVDCGDVGCEAGETKVEGRVAGEGEDFGVVV